MQGDRINNKEEALDAAMKISLCPRSGWIKKGSRAKANETIELPRTFANELANKTIGYYIFLEELLYDPFCDCAAVKLLLQKAITELPEGETAAGLRRLSLNCCPVCGVKYED